MGLYAIDHALRRDHTRTRSTPNDEHDQRPIHESPNTDQRAARPADHHYAPPHHRHRHHQHQPPPPSLETLAYKYGTDKSKDDHKYVDLYHSLFADREKAVGTFTEVVVYDNAQVCVEWIIWYKREMSPGSSPGSAVISSMSGTKKDLQASDTI